MKKRAAGCALNLTKHQLTNDRLNVVNLHCGKTKHV